jgi:catechol 2,3-dioxygenase-like lactoylglutathione lyase family enzyme
MAMNGGAIVVVAMGKATGTVPGDVRTDDQGFDGLRTRALHHVALGVADVARTARFYREVLGLPDEPRPPGARGAAVWLRVGDAILMIEEGPPAAPRALVLAIEPAERERWRRHLSAAGQPVEDETPFTIYFRDPAGNRVGLSHHPVAAGPAVPAVPAE